MSAGNHSGDVLLRTAILDLYNEHPNQGMRCIKQILDDQPFPVSWDVYDVRSMNEIPSLSYEAYIFSGGPGSPLEDDKPWCQKLFSLMDALFEYNMKHPGAPKFAFYICHSFQILCHRLGVADVCLRNSPAFGIFPVHKTGVNGEDPVFGKLPEPFYAVDSRDWQVIGPSDEKLADLGAQVVALEKIRPHVDFARAVMAIRFSDAIVGTQFHPEADVPGMGFYIRQEEKKKHIIDHHGAEKYHAMLEILGQDDKILLTHNTILPAFLRQAFDVSRSRA